MEGSNKVPAHAGTLPDRMFGACMLVSNQVKAVEARFAAVREEKGVLKAERQAAQGDDYLCGMDLPPSDDAEDDDDDDEEYEDV